jgi:peptidoglycan/xylan/chitin deacetylase (PgdA/CDA1 family)
MNALLPIFQYYWFDCKHESEGSMGISRKLLYGTYRALKTAGYLDKRHKDFPVASILLFHRVSNTSSDYITTRPDLFDDLMREIKSEFEPTPLSILVEAIQSRTPPAPKTVAITFDDAYGDTFRYAAPILLKYGIPATFFITSGYIGTDKSYPWDAETDQNNDVMNWEEVKELARSGFEIGSHTVNHLNLGHSSFEAIRDEMVRSKSQIENVIQKEVKSFAYPFGWKDSIALSGPEIAQEAGYECCCMAYGGKVTEKSNPYYLHRIGSYPTLIEFMMELDNFMTYYDGKMNINLFGKPREYNSSQGYLEFW